MTELTFWNVLLGVFGVLFLVFFAVTLAYLVWMMTNTITTTPAEQLAAYIRECRALEISMETCERLAANVLGG